MTKTIYVSIGNSDDKLTQREWASYHGETDFAISYQEKERHGAWESWSAANYQNACWCIEIDDQCADVLKQDLARIAARFRQDSIAWAEATTEFIKAAA